MGYGRFRRPLPLVARRSLDVARRSALTACEHPDTRSAIGSRRSPLVARISEFRYAYLLYLLQRLRDSERPDDGRRSAVGDRCS